MGLLVRLVGREEGGRASRNNHGCDPIDVVEAHEKSRGVHDTPSDSRHVIGTSLELESAQVVIICTVWNTKDVLQRNDDHGRERCVVCIITFRDGNGVITHLHGRVKEEKPITGVDAKKGVWEFTAKEGKALQLAWRQFEGF